MLSALAGLWGTALFFQLIYPGFYRHQAIWIVFLITLYWFAFARPARSMQVRPSIKSRLLLCSFYGAFAALLAMCISARCMRSARAGRLAIYCTRILGR